MFQELFEWRRKRKFHYINGAPSDDTFRRFFRGLHPQKFQEKFRNWVADDLPPTEDAVIAIDGKTSRGSTDKVGGEKRTLHLVIESFKDGKEKRHKIKRVSIEGLRNTGGGGGITPFLGLLSLKIFHEV
ncbi:MAG: hypothetical protein LBF65_03030, partial [Holosporales bacterium]|nr:hypothetical protein [Holosporales bacterium]